MDTATIQAIVDAHQHRPGATLPILHDIQAALGFIPDEAIAIVAHGLNLSRAEIYGVVTFYADFRTTPPGRHILQICRGEACQAKGSRDLEDHARRALGIDFHETTADGAISLEPVFCLGNCACSPSVRLGDEILGRVDAAVFDDLVAEARANTVGQGAQS
jgi:formate dehydrogenase subunit gamma